MPKRSDPYESKDRTDEEVEVRRWKTLPRKRTKVSLPFRSQRGARQIDDSAGRPKLPRLRHPVDTSLRSRPTSSNVETYRDERDDVAARSDQSLLIPLRQPTVAISNHLRNTKPLFDNRRKQDATVTHAQGHTRLDAYKDSPYVILGSGGGDPFSTLPSNLPRAFLDEYLHTIPGILATMVSRGPSGKDYGKAWAMEVMSSMTSNMALFYSMIFAGMLHTRVQSGSLVRSPLEFEVGARAIRLISRDMRNLDRARLDASIWVVVILGFAGKEAPLRTGSKYPRQSFLKELQDLHIYCKMEIVLEHVFGLIRLLELIGGLQNVKTPGMAQIISFCGIMGACRSLERPIFPFLAHSNQFMVEGRLAIDDQEREWASSALGRLGSGFWEVWGFSRAAAVKDLCIVIRHVCDFTIVVENYIEGRWSPRTFTVIIDQRNFVQHSLMSLKTEQELLDDGVAIDEGLYESCRLAVIVFSFLIVFPLPPVAGPFELLTEQLLEELSAIDIHGQPLIRSRLILWILVMGAVAAIGLPERQWFLSRIRPLLLEMVIGDWKDMKSLLQSFLWLPSTNDPDGQEMWTEIQIGNASVT